MSSATTGAATSWGSGAASGLIAARGSDAATAGAVQAGRSDPASRLAPGRVRIDRYELDLGPWLHLAGQAGVVEYQFRVHWAPETVVFWDNRSVQHYAASDYYPDVRIMERASIVGTRPA